MSAHDLIAQAAGRGAVTAAYTYGDTATHPSAVTSIVRTGGTVPVTDSFVYDDAGRMVTRTTGAARSDPGVSTDLSWDVSSNLVESDGAGGHRVYLYDASGQRVAQVTLDDPATVDVGGAVTGYLGSTELTDADTAVNHTAPSELKAEARTAG